MANERRSISANGWRPQQCRPDAKSPPDLAFGVPAFLRLSFMRVEELISTAIRQ
jgi:hypothetical protein